MQDICGFATELPLGVRLDGGTRLREFSVIKSSWVTQKLILDDQLRSTAQHEWLARLVSSVVESIAGQPVYKPFSRSDFETIPPVVLKLPLSDIRYVLALAHMHTYGSMVDLGKQKCPACGRRDLLKLDLRAMRVDPSKHEDNELIVAKLPTGFYEEGPSEEQQKKGAVVLPFHSKKWNRLILRPPTLEDAIKHRDFLTPRHMITFELRLHTDCIVGMESWEVKEGEQTVKLDEMERKALNMKGHNLLPALDSADHRAIRLALNGLPQANLMLEHRCSNCGDEVETLVEVTSFFPMA
jgi:hypothetical protein